MHTLLDLRGTVIHSLNAGVDPDGGKTADGKKLNSVGFCLQNFIETYFLPSLEYSRLNDIIACQDSGNDYRKAIYPEYKANREKAKEDVEMVERQRQCQDTVVEFLKGMGVPLASANGIEADDVIGYFCKYLPGPKLIHTVDQDLIQLAAQNVAVFVKRDIKTAYTLNNGSGATKKHLMDVEPRHVALCKSIIGDASDNYTGVNGLGPVKFHYLAETFGLDGLDELVEIIDNENYEVLKDVYESSNDKVIGVLYDKRHEWRTGWRLANLAPDIVEARAGNKFNRLRWTNRVPNPARVKLLLEAYGCRHLWPKLKDLLPTQTLVTADNVPSLEWLEEQFKLSPFVALDWETSDKLQNPAFKEASNGREFIDMLSSDITGAGFTFGHNLEHTIYISFDHKDTANVDRSFLLDVLAAIPEDKHVAIQNVMFEITLLKNTTGYSIANAMDTKVMASYVDENDTAGLKFRSKSHLNYDQIKYEDVIENGMRMCDYPAEHVFQYGADDPLVTAHLYDHYKKIMQIEGTWDFCIANEMLPIELISDGFLAGVEINWPEMKRQEEEDRATLEKSMLRLRELISSHQTEDMIADGVECLYNEGIEEVIAKTKVKAEKAYVPEQVPADPDNPDCDSFVIAESQDQFINRSIIESCKLWQAKCEDLVTYRPYVVVPKEKDWNLTVTSLRPILDKLGLPPLGTVKPADAEVVGRWIEEVRTTGLTREQANLVDRLGAAVSNNKTSTTKTKNSGRTHPNYLDFVEHVQQYVEQQYDATGSELNLGSPVQMKALLYGMLDLPIRLRGFEVSDTRKALGLTTPTAQANKDAVVTAMAEDCAEFPWKKEALECLTAASQCRTRISLFYEPYPLWKHPIDNLIHPQVNSCGTETRRPTGSSPNPLQWPKRGEGVKFRRCVLPNKKLGHDLIVSLDWSQQELRVAAALSMDDAFLDCYIGKDVEHVLSDTIRQGLPATKLAKFLQTNTKDIHTQTATGILKWTYEETVAALEGDDKVLAKQAKNARGTSKNVNFGSSYGIGAAKLARQLICPVEDAKQFLKDKKELYVDFEVWRENVLSSLEKEGQVKTTFGNRRHMHNLITTGDDKELSRAQRQAVNFLIQGVCADNLKRTLSEIYLQGILARTGAVLIAPIYDEVVFSVNHAQAVDLILSVHAIMTRDIPGMLVPMLAEPSLGLNFGDQIEIGRFPTPATIQGAINEAFGKERHLLYHPESDSLFEEWESVKVYEALECGGCVDVTGMDHHEAAFGMQFKAAA